MVELYVPPMSRAQFITDAFMSMHYGATLEDWEQAADDTRFVELIDDRLMLHSRVSEDHARAFRVLSTVLATYVECHDLGIVYGGPRPVNLGPARRLEPDLYFLSKATKERCASGVADAPPDFVIEIASPCTRVYDREDKRDCYRDAGVGEYWMIDPRDKRVTVDLPAGQEVGSYVEGWVASTCCPGFAVRAEWLWAEPSPGVRACVAELERRQP